MGVLKKLTTEYFGETERKEDTIELPEGVERVDFTDRNGRRHKKGYKVTNGDGDILYQLIMALVEKRGPECDLNDVDVSNVKDMRWLFSIILFNGNISGWDVSSAEDMNRMFMNSAFNGDISKWDVSNVMDMIHMFYNSSFKGNISRWKVNPKCDTTEMFDKTPLESNPPEWYHQ
jgi:hypothetical protein